MQHGWLKDSDRWYYLGWESDPDSGAMRRGWIELEDKWYYLGWENDPDSGAMRRGWLEDGGKWYYLGWESDPDSGAMRKGWINVDNRWYYLSESGALQQSYGYSGGGVNGGGNSRVDRGVNNRRYVRNQDYMENYY